MLLDIVKPIQAHIEKKTKFFLIIFHLLIFFKMYYLFPL